VILYFLINVVYMVDGEVLADEDFFMLCKAMRRHRPLSQIMKMFGEAVTFLNNL
jgi:hypothetical protein